MNLDEETFLTAYLDGTLGPEQRVRVESAVATDPCLSSHLRDLAAVRGLVAGLSRPTAGIDLSGPVLAAIARRRRFGLPPLRLAGARLLSTPAGRAAALLALAASLLVVASATFIVTLPRQGGPAPNLVAGHVQPAPPPVVPRPVPESLETPSTKLAEASAAPASRSVDPRSLVPGDDERRRDEDVEKVRRLLDSPNLQRSFVIADVARGKAHEQVDSLLARLPRKHATYVRVDVGAAVSPDTDHPGDAVVFAAVVDDGELKELQSNLRREFPFDIEETGPDPAKVTMLADLGTARIRTGTPVADVIVPQEHFASKGATPPAAIPIGRPFSPSVPPNELFVPDPFRPRPAPATATPGAAGTTPAKAAQPAGPAARRPQDPHQVVLVWVTRPAGTGETAP